MFCEVCQQIGNESFCFKRKEGLSRHQKSENRLRNNPYYDEVYNKRKNDQSNAQKNEKKRKLMYDINNIMICCNITILKINLLHMKL